MPVFIRIYSFIELFAKNGVVKTFEGNPEKVLTDIRSECTEKWTSLEEWARIIREHGPLASTHPFSRWCNEMQLSEVHPMRTIGSWAYGFQNSYIEIDHIRMEDGRQIVGNQFRV